MKTLLSGLKRWSIGADNVIAGQIGRRLGRGGRRGKRRARLGLECLETRDLMSGMAVTPPVSGVPAPPGSGGTAILLPPASLTATAVAPTEITLAWNDQVRNANESTVFEVNGSTLTTLTELTGDPHSYTVAGLTPDSAYEFMVSINGPTYRSGSSFVVNAQQSNAASTTTFTGAPTVSAVGVATSEINLTWGSELGATGYTVEIEEGRAWVPLQNLGSGATYSFATGLNAGTAYDFRVGASYPSGID